VFYTHLFTQFLYKDLLHNSLLWTYRKI